MISHFKFVCIHSHTSISWSVELTRDNSIKKYVPNYLGMEPNWHKLKFSDRKFDYINIVDYLRMEQEGYKLIPSPLCP